MFKGAPNRRALVRIISGPSFKWFERQFLRGVDRGEDSQNPAILYGFSAVLSRFMGFQSASDSVIRC